MAREAGVKQLIVPLLHVAPVWSAFGAAIASVAHVYQRWQVLEMPADPAQVAAVFSELENEARTQLRDEGFQDDRIELRRFVRMKYSVQAFDVEVPVPGGPFGDAELASLEEDFHRVYDELHGKGAGYREGGSRITGFVVRSRGLSDEPPIAGDARPARPERASRPVFWEELGEFAETPVLRMDGSVFDERLEGPLLIEMPDTVVVIRPGHRAHFDEFGSLIITMPGSTG